MLNSGDDPRFRYSDQGHSVAPPTTRETIGSALAVARRQAWWILFFLVVGVGLGTIYLANAGPKYTASSTLLIDTRKSEIFQQPSVFSQTSMESSAALDSQVEILKSEPIALAVIKKLGLGDDPEFISPVSSFRDVLFGWISARGNAKEPTSDERTAAALLQLSKNLSVGRVGMTYAIEIAFDSSSAARAAQVANAVAEAYIDRQLASQYNAARQASDYLEARIQELRGQAESAQRAVVEYKKQNNIVENAQGQLVSDQRVADLTSQLNLAHDDVVKKKAMYDQLEALLKQNGPNAILGASIDEPADSDAIAKLRDRYNDLSYREADLASRYGPSHLAVIDLRKQLDQVRSQIVDAAQHLSDSRKNDYLIGTMREDSIRREVADAISQSQSANQAQVKLQQLEASAKTYQALYDSLLARYATSIQEQTSPVAEASIIRQASPPAAPSYKKPLLFWAVFSLAGLVAGIGVAALRELFGQVFWTTKPIATELGAKCIAILPLVAKSVRKNSLASRVYSKLRRSREAVDSKSLVRGDMAISWAAVDDSHSRFSEGLRSIRLAVDRVRSAPGEVVGFTSALPNEGKSTVALAFGQLVARSGRRVIVVDCDLRNPSITRSVAPNATIGIFDIIDGAASIDEVICRDPSTQMDFLPTVARASRIDSFEALASDQMKGLFDALRARYDYVIVDLSPLAPIVDVAATTHLIDSYVLVVEWGRTKIGVVRHALRAAPEFQTSLLGVVLNKVDIKRLATYDNVLFDYYSNVNYQRYGMSKC